MGDVEALIGLRGGVGSPTVRASAVRARGVECIVRRTASPIFTSERERARGGASGVASLDPLLTSVTLSAVDKVVSRGVVASDRSFVNFQTVGASGKVKKSRTTSSLFGRCEPSGPELRLRAVDGVEGVGGGLGIWRSGRFVIARSLPSGSSKRSTRGGT